MVNEEAIMSDLISLHRAAVLLKVNQETARRWAKKGTFPGDAARKQGNKWVVSVRRLNRYFHGEAS
jgi:predicted site-specific integrase-resolvase